VQGRVLSMLVKQLAPCRLPKAPDPKPCTLNPKSKIADFYTQPCSSFETICTWLCNAEFISDFSRSFIVFKRLSRCSCAKMILLLAMALTAEYAADLSWLYRASRAAVTRPANIQMAVVPPAIRAFPSHASDLHQGECASDMCMFAATL
jgi:hypothetical protein